MFLVRCLLSLLAQWRGFSEPQMVATTAHQGHEAPVHSFSELESTLQVRPEREAGNLASG